MKNENNIDPSPFRKSLFSRESRVVLLPLVIGLVIYRAYLSWSGGVWGTRLIWIGLFFFFFFWWKMDRADIQHLAEQDRLAEQDPKHLYNSDVGIRYNRVPRQGISFGLILMGIGNLFLAFELLTWNYIFFGAALGIAGAILLVLF